MPEWEPDLTIKPPSWLVEGALVSHTTFGLGTVGRVGFYKDVPTVWIDFDGGSTKALALEFGLPHLVASNRKSGTGTRGYFGRKRKRRI